ncbi:hypothetical protein U2057_15390, partial [Listeria monocytogenes]|uniref:hypothetical protein n=1 Tax=Listeria monocytogenes TaxID=1639 RepID=UPI002FDBD66C
KCEDDDAAHGVHAGAVGQVSLHDFKGFDLLALDVGGAVVELAAFNANGLAVAGFDLAGVGCAHGLLA